MESKTKKRRIWSIVLDVLLGIIVVMLLIVCISALSSRNRGYTSFFGNAVFAVETDSMTGNYKGSFDKYALIFSKPLNAEEAQKLKKGDVITFHTKINNVWTLNTHRIVGIDNNGCYITQGDKAYDLGAAPDKDTVSPSAVVALHYSADFNGKEYKGAQIGGIGAIIIFGQTSGGFFTMVVVPSILILIYCGFAFAMAIKRVKTEMSEEDKKKAEAEKQEAEKEALKEQLRAELMQELEKKDSPAKTDAAPPKNTKPKK